MNGRVAEVKHLTMKTLAEDDRPREKLMNKGRQSLSDAELLAILLGSGTVDETALQLAQRILRTCDNSINGLAGLSLHDLKQFRGVGEAKALGIAAALELGRRRSDSEELSKIQILSSRASFRFFYPMLCDLPYEEFWAMYVNRRGQVIKTHCISKGGIHNATIDVRLILKPALECLATSIILAHNHPSGTSDPSAEDLSITASIRDAAKIMNMKLMDHLIIAGQSYYSFSDHGLL